MSDLTPQQHQAYYRGKKARREGKGHEACDFFSDIQRHYWLCGWHDADIEAGVRIYNGPERARSEAR